MATRKPIRETSILAETAREARERRNRHARRAREEALEARAPIDHSLGCTCFACCAVRDGYAAEDRAGD